jgi:hypothetical protein
MFSGCTRMFPMFHLFFRSMLQVCLSGFCISFTYMLQVFYLDVAYVCNGFQVFSDVFCKCLRRMLQEFQLFLTYVVSVLSGFCKSRLRYCTCCEWTRERA